VERISRSCCVTWDSLSVRSGSCRARGAGRTADRWSFGDVSKEGIFLMALVSRWRSGSHGAVSKIRHRDGKVVEISKSTLSLARRTRYGFKRSSCESRCCRKVNEDL
jgi:hypothetical protein